MTVSFLLLIALPGLALAAATIPQTLKSGEVLRGRFIQDRQLAGFAKPLRTEGTFVLVPGRGLIWRAETPFRNTTVITPEGILGQVNGQETMRLPTSRMPGLGHLYDVLGGAVSGNIAPLGQVFAVKRSEVAGGWQMYLTPLHPDNPQMSQIKSLTVVGHRFVETIEVDKDGGDVDRLSFLNQSVVATRLTADEITLLGTLGK
ncbi:MAG: LolA-related protein [Rhizomicrobium sp.]